MDHKQLSKIDGLLKEMVDTSFAAGASVLVLKDGEERYYGQAGLRDIENNLPFERNTISRLYSMSKPITSLAAMILLEDGAYELDDPVSKYIPSFNNQVIADRYDRFPVTRPATIRDLLNMSAGLAYGGVLNVTEHETNDLINEGVSRIGTNNEMSTMEFANRLGKLPLMFQPGCGFNYSTCADVMGAVIEAISGKSFGEFLHKRILDPLSMNDTEFYVSSNKQSRLSKVYEDTNEGLKEYTYNHLIINLKGDHKPAFESGGAGLFSTIDDYAKFATMLQNGGITKEGQKIIGSKTIEFMRSASTQDAVRPMFYKGWGDTGYDYCNFLRIMKDSTKSPILAVNGEYGWDGWLGCYFINVPSENMTFLMMMQRANAGTTNYTRRIRNVVYSAL